MTIYIKSRLYFYYAKKNLNPASKINWEIYLCIQICISFDERIHNSFMSSFGCYYQVCITSTILYFIFKLHSRVIKKNISTLKKRSWANFSTFPWQNCLLIIQTNMTISTEALKGIILTTIDKFIKWTIICWQPCLKINICSRRK